MKTRLMMFVAVIALFVFNGCSDSKESYVKDFKKFIELTIDEQIEITKLKATYATRRGLSNLKNGVDKLLDSDILKMEKNKK